MFKFFASNCVFINLCDKLNFVPGFSNINKCVYESFYSDCKPALINDKIFCVLYLMCYNNCAIFILYCTVLKFVFLSVCLCVCLSLSRLICVVFYLCTVVNKRTHYGRPQLCYKTWSAENSTKYTTLSSECRPVRPMRY